MAGAGTSKSYIFGLRIFLDDKASPITPDATIGLYNVASDNSQFRWINVFTINTTDTWKDDIFTEGGLKGFGIAGDYRRGGNLPEIKDITVEIKNSLDGVDKFFKKLEDLGITLNGLYCELVEIDLLIAHGGTRANETILYRGICNLITEWDELTCTIPIKCSFYKRKTNISTVIDGTATGQFPEADENITGDIVPATFGEQEKAKFIRTENSIENFIVHSITNTNWYTEVGHWFFAGAIERDIQIYPVVGNDGKTPPEMYRVKIGLSGSLWFPPSLVPPASLDLTPLFYGKYLHVVEGAGQDSYRMILSALVTSSDYSIIEITVAAIFEEALISYGTGTFPATNTSWVQIETINRAYMADIWKCFGFLDNDDIKITGSELLLYSYTEEKSVTVQTTGVKTPVDEAFYQFVRLPEYMFINSDVSINNKIDIDVKLFKGNIDRVSSFIILPPKNLALSIKSNLTDFGMPNAIKIVDGFYDGLGGLSSPMTLAITGAIADIIDRDYSTYMQFKPSMITGDQATIALSFQLPTFPENLSFDSMYFGIRSISYPYVSPDPAASSNKYVEFYMRKFYGAQVATYSINNPSTTKGLFHNLPEAYYLLNAPSNKDRDFFYKQNNVLNVSTGFYENTGYDIIEISGINTKEIYNSIHECLFAYRITAGSPVTIPTFQLYELTIMFKKDISIKEDLFTPLAGRIFNDTWDSRKTAADLIENPIDIAEHILRLQNWSEVGDIKKYGLEYSPNALINTGSASEGQLDHIILDSIKAFKVRRQVLDFDDANSDEVLTSLCKEFFMTVYQNQQGKESIIPIGKVASTPVVSVALTDIQPGSISRITTQLPQDVFVNPIVNYNFNNASKKHDGVIKILNANMPTFVSSYVEGITETDAEHIWDMCHALWEYHREIYDPPSSMTNLDWIYKEEDAISYLRSWLQYMGVYDTESGIQVWPNKRVTFTVDYATATTIGASHSPWHIGMYLNLTLPFHTSGLAIQCQIESIDFDLDNMTAEVQVIMYGVSDEINYYIQKTFDSYAGIGNADWQNMYTDKATVPSQGNDVQNNT